MDWWTLGIYIFIASLLFVAFVARVRHIEALSLYWIFIAFQTLYNIIPWFENRLDIVSLSLLKDTAVINMQLLLAATANVCFGTVFWFLYQKTFLNEASVPHLRPTARRDYVLMVFPLFLIVCSLSAKYGWNQFASGAVGASTPGGMFTLTAYAKDSFVAVYLYYLYRFGLDKFAWMLLAEQVVVLAIDGARTTFLPIALLTAIILNGKIDPRKRFKVYIISVLGLLAAVGARSAIVEGESLLVKLSIPITVEGTMGAYPDLQTIYAVKTIEHPKYTYGMSYVLDPITWFMPNRSIRLNYEVFQSWIDQISPILQNDFAPMGGFYYLSEAIAAFSYLGPAIVTTLFGLSIIWMERNKNRHRLLYMVWVPNIGILFVKTMFGNIVKMFVIQLLAVCIIVLLAELKKFSARACRSAAHEMIRHGKQASQLP